LLRETTEDHHLRERSRKGPQSEEKIEEMKEEMKKDVYGEKN
jgi:hypothetical protein